MDKWDAQVQQVMLSDEKEAIKNIKEAYKSALNDVNQKIQELQMQINELQIGVNADDAVTQSLIQSKVYQKQYQEAIKQQINTILDSVTSSNYQTINEYLKKSYEDGYVGTMYSLHQQGIPVIMPIDQEQVARAIVTDSKLSETLYKKLNIDTNELKKSIRSELSRGISQNMSYSDISRNINNAMNVGINKAIRIARTEGHRIQNQSSMDGAYAAKDNGADIVKQWDAAMDKRTRPSHQRVDGEIRELDEPFSNGLMYPGDPSGSAGEVINCRCALLQRAKWALDEDELNTLKERANYYGLDKTKGFDDFKTQYLSSASSESALISPQNITSFVNAKKIEEAQEYAQQFIGNGYSKTFKNKADFSGISLEHANEINKTLSELYSQYDMPMINGIKTISPTSAQGKKIFTSADAVAAYSPIEHGIFINKNVVKNASTLANYNKESSDAWNIVMSNIDNLSGSQKELALTYKNAGRDLVGDGSLHDYIVHEMGHHVQWDVLDTKTNNLIGSNMNKFAPSISGYANASKGEYIAESFVAYTKGETDILDPEFVAYLKNGVVSSTQSSKIETAIENVRKGTSTLSTVYLPKDEFAHVMSEFNTHMSDTDRIKPIVSKPIGNYIYTIENNGFDDYRVIGKVPIDDDYLEK